MRILNFIIVSVILSIFCMPAIATEDIEYFAVFIDSKKVGHAIQGRTVTNGKVTTSEQVSLTLSRGGVAMTIEMSEAAIETVDGKPVSFETIQQLGALMMTVTGTIDAQGQIQLTTSSLGAQESSTMEWPEGAVMAEGLRLIALKKGLKEGTKYQVKIFSPGSLQAMDANIHIGPKQNEDLLGRIVALTEITTTINMPDTGQITTISYVDEEMKSLKTITNIAGMQVELLSCTKEFALSDNDVLEMLDKMFISSPEPLKNVGSASSIAYLLAPKEGADLVIPSNDNQSVRQLEDGRLVLIIKPAVASSGVKFPYKGSDKTIIEATQPSRYLQSEQKEIVQLARKAVGNTKDATEAARKIEAFVADYIDNKGLSVGYASAAEVLESRQGDCSEFAVLTAALCRAVGIPAQVVVGLAYVEDFAGFQGFGGHAWTQAYLGDKWVGLDSAFKSAGLGGYDAGHIALDWGNGEPADFFNMAAALGNFKIEKVEVK